MKKGTLFLIGISLWRLPMSAPLNEPSEQLNRLFKDEWEYTLRENPTFASLLGDRRYNTRWPDVRLGAIERRYEHERAVIRTLLNINYDALSQEDQLSYVLFKKKYQMGVEGHSYRWHLLPIDQLKGIQTESELADSLSFATSQDYADWLARLRSFPVYMEQVIALMKEGIRLDLTHPRVIMERVSGQITTQIVENPADSLFFKPFQHFPPEISQPDRERLLIEAREAIAEQIVPSFQIFYRFFTEEYLPACHDRVGLWQLPQGKELYAFRVRLFTTTDLTPEEIHAIGLLEVKRIRGEMERVIKEVEFEGTFQEFLSFLRTDRRFYYQESKQLLEGYQALCKRLDPVLVQFFGRLPRIPYGVEPIPDYIAADTTTAYYRPPAADGSRAGTYFVNLYKPEARPKYEMEALSIHEAVPGHHLQIALAMELGELPEFRRYNGYTAFTEGWALYTESLGEELGFYQDPYMKFGQLTYEMWRAVRLVVDTGIHHFRWSRQRAIDFFKANVAKTELDIVNEIDRYAGWPAQALAYKVGELKIKELRALATRELGARFDVRGFHDMVLGSGAVPLDVLETMVKQWITVVGNENDQEGSDCAVQTDL